MSLKSENNWIWIQYQILFQSESLPVLQCKGEGEGTEPWGPPDAQTGNGTHPDSGSVVLNLQQLQAAVFHGHLDVCGLCIQTETLKHIHVGLHSCVELSLNTWRDFRQTYYLFFSITNFQSFPSPRLRDAGSLLPQRCGSPPSRPAAGWLPPCSSPSTLLEVLERVCFCCSQPQNNPGWHLYPQQMSRQQTTRETTHHSHTKR